MVTGLKVTCLALLIMVSTNAQLFEGDTCTRNDGSPGVCKIIEDCQVAKDEFSQGIVPFICGFKQRLPIVCCPESRPVTKSTPRPETSKPATPSPKPVDNTHSKSKQKCIEYSSYVYSKSGGVAPLIPDYEPDKKGKDECIIGRTLIIGGVPAEPKEFPHMALLGFGEKNSITWGCGGSLISERFVLTAAHCLSTKELGIVRWIRLGDLNIRRTDDFVETQEFSVAKIIRHPGYKSPAHYNDIALLQLDRDATFDQGYVRPACIHSEEAVPDEKLVATGWGLTDWVGPKGSDELRKVGLDNIDPTNCNDTFAPLIGGRKLRVGITSDSMVCAGDLKGGKDTCKGDSGGPLQVKLEEPYCMYDIIGITSFGSICGAINSPAIYTRVSNYIQWIESVVWP